MRRQISFLVCSLLSFELVAQDVPLKDFNPASLVDEIFATQDLNVSYEDLYENYLQLLSNPLDLNTVTDEQLRSLYILSQEQINAFLNYRKETGTILSEYELQTIFDEAAFEKIVPFVTVIDKSKILNKAFFKTIVSEHNNYLLLRWGRTLEQQKGYTENATPSTKYLGSPDNFYARYRASRSGDFSVGFTMKKDAGEKIDWNSSQKYFGFDYLSFHLQALNKGRFRNIIIGDYQAQFGQGLTLGSVFGIGKNGETVNTMRRANIGFTPYTSIYEAGYFRGAATSVSLNNNITLHAMLSSRGRDGSLQTDTLANSSDYLSSFSYTGLHRTANELTNRNAVIETNEALVLKFKNQHIDAGLIGHNTHFSSQLLRNPTPYNQFSFNGDNKTNIGGYFNYNFSNFALFSEVTQTVNHGRAIVAGILGSLNAKMESSLVYRKFERDFYSFYSNAIAENSVPQNEEGIYWGLKYSFNKKISAAGYIDLFNFPWLKYRNYSPSDGSEWLLRFNWRPSKTVYVFLQMKEENKQRNLSDPSNLYLTANGTKRSYWINCDYSATQRLSFRTRAQFSDYQLGKSFTQGMVLLQDVSLDFRKFSIIGRFAIFDTDDYDNRIYVYERDAWLSFSFPAYYGKGVRQFLLLQYKLTSKIDIWLRWANTSYLNQEIIGNGGDQIIGSSKNDVKFQARIKL